jgi:hypothetical protein
VTLYGNCENVQTSSETLVTKELAVASWQFTASHFLFHQGISDQKQLDYDPPPTPLARLGPLCEFSVFPIEDTAILTQLR